MIVGLSKKRSHHNNGSRYINQQIQQSNLYNINSTHLDDFMLTNDCWIVQKTDLITTLDYIAYHSTNSTVKFKGKFYISETIMDKIKINQTEFITTIIFI